jgi:CO/xanthine dehydrogenase FAD-binding subunit
MTGLLTYLAPKDLSELFKALEDNPQAAIMAGGTDLLVDARKKGLPETLLDIKQVQELGIIKLEADYLVVGAVTTVNALNQSDEIAHWYPALKQAASGFGCYEIRNRATFGGSVMRASPGAEFAPLLWVAEAKVRLRSSRGMRELPIAEFVVAPGKTMRQPGEVLEAVLLPLYEFESALQGYRRVARVAGMDLASLNAAVLVINARKTEKRIVRLAFGAVAPLPDRPREVEELLSGKEFTPELLGQAKRMLYKRYQPRATSLRATPEYKKLMAGNLLEMMLEELGLINDK